MITSPITCTHEPNGTKFYHIPNAYRWVKTDGTWATVRDKTIIGGVVIEYADGVKIFRPTEFYN